MSIFTSIGNFFTGGNDKKKKTPTTTTTTTKPQALVTSKNTNAPLVKAPQGSNPFQVTTTTTTAAPKKQVQPTLKKEAPKVLTPQNPYGQPLVKAQPQLQVVKPPQQRQILVGPQTNPLQKMVDDNANPQRGGEKPDFKAVGRGAAAGVASTAVDVVKALPDLYDLATPGKGKNRASQALDKVNTKLEDFAGKGQGQDAMQKAKIAALPLTLLGPAELKALTKAPGAVDALEGVPRVVTGAQKLKKAGGFIKGKLSQGGVTSNNVNQVEDAAKQLLEQEQRAAAATPNAPTNLSDAEAGRQVITEPPRKAPVVDAATDLDTPAYQRVPAKNAAADAELAAQEARANELGVGTELTDTPAFERNGVQLPSDRPTSVNPSDVHNELHDTAAAVAADPQLADYLGEAFRQTGIANPFSLITHVLTNINDKAAVRGLVKRLVPGIQGNNLNRTVNAVTGADDSTEIAQILAEAGTNNRTALIADNISTPPLGPLSDAPAPSPAAVANEATPPVAPVEAAPTPAPAPTPDVAPATVEPTPAVATPVTRTPEEQAAIQQTGDAIHGRDTFERPLDAPTGQTAPAAPRTHDALVREMGDAGKTLKGQYAERDVLNLEDLRNNAEGVIANMDDDTVIRSFATADRDTMISSPQSFALGRAALDRLGKMADNPEAQNIVSDILDSMAKYESKNAQGLRIAQEAFDSLPLPMKVRYIVKKIDGANKDVDGYMPLRDRVDDAASIERTITDYLRGSEAINERVAAAEGRLRDIQEAALRGEKTDQSISTIVKTLESDRRALAANNGELAKFYQSFIPKRSKGQRVNDFARRMMLASVTGRINDVISTAANVVELGSRNVVQGVIAKAVNLAKPGTVTDTFRGVKAFGQGTAEGLKKAGGEFAGKQYSGDLQKALQGNTDLRSGLTKTQGKIGRTIQAATEFATHASQGVKNQRVYQLAVKEGQQRGLKGDMLKQYAEARAATPNAHMLQQAETLREEVNNLNQNWLSDKLNRIGLAMDDKSGVGGFIKNQVMPFTSWLGGNIWNSVTDRNVIAAAIKLGDSAFIKKDPEGAVRNLSKLVTSSAETYALGWVLTDRGILTNENAEGYNDGGAYFHIGDRYIPIGLAGAVAPSIVLGNAAHQAFNSDAEGSMTDKLAMFVKTTGENSFNALNLGGALGVDTNLSRAYDAKQRPGGSLADGGAVLGAGAVGQFAPSIFGDVNSVLDNYTGLNPTREAADTKVVQDKLTKDGKPSTAKDVPRSAVKTLQNRIPFASQQLPRKAGVAAKDPVDRITRGDRDTDTSIKNRTDAKAKVDFEKDLQARDIPNYQKDGFANAVEARLERGEYDKSIEALNTKLKADRANKDVPKSETDQLEKKVKQFEVAKNQKLTYDDMKLYNDTSLTEWRNLGDPDKDEYDPDTYQKLYDMDNALKAAGVAGAIGIKSTSVKGSDKPKFTAKTDTKKQAAARSGKGASDALKKVTSNTLGDIPSLGKVDFGKLSLQKASSTPAPKIQKLRASDLKKKRIISIKKA